MLDDKNGRTGCGGTTLLIEPLRKATLGGQPYARPALIQSRLGDLLDLPREKILELIRIRDRNAPGYVPSECLVYLLRAARTDNREQWFNTLYGELLERVLRRLPKADSSDGVTRSLKNEAIRDDVLGRMSELITADRSDYSLTLDYFEIRFDSALANLKKDAQDRAWRHENRSETLEFNGRTGELPHDVERAAGSFDPLDSDRLDDTVYRSRLYEAIDALPKEQSRIIHMLLEGFPIDSKEPSVVTISSTLGRAEKTVRTYRDKAYATLRDVLGDGADK